MYYPKNKIQTNLYTSREGFYVTDSGLPYTGYYWKTFEGKFYTGKNPNDKPTKELIFIENVEENLDIFFPQTQIAIVDGPLELIDTYDSEILLTYVELKNIDVSKNTRKYLPYPIIPQPTSQDYQIGEFRRYFAKKINETKFIEINKDIYNNINTQNSGWLWELYQVFFIPWQISDDKSVVSKTNQNIVMLTMKRLNVYGFDKYLKENYTQFWLP
jgi:hypothetical protein